MKKYWAKHALTEDGWKESVLLTVANSGNIVDLSAGSPPEGTRCSVLLPAPPNLHSHCFQRVMAGLTESRSQAVHDDFWTWRRTMYKLLEHLTPDDVETIAAQAQMEMLEAGFASVAEFHYLHHGAGGQRHDNPAEMSLRIVSAAANTGIGLTLLPVMYKHSGMECAPLEGAQLRFGCDTEEFAELMATAQKATNQAAPDFRTGCAAHSMRALPLAEIAAMHSTHAGMPLHIHAAEQVAEVESVVETTSRRPVEWLLENACTDSNWCLIHCTHMTSPETKGLARSGAVAGLCPITEANLGDGIFNGKEYVRAGGHYGVGTDSNVRISLTGELRTLEYSQRLRHQSRSVLAINRASPARDMLEGVCQGGAMACGRNCGGLAVGKLADLIELDDESMELSGLDGDRLLDSWVFASTGNQVKNVWSAGRHVVRYGRHIRRDAIAGNYLKVQDRLRKSVQDD